MLMSTTETFTAGEAGAITGITTTTQLDWRRRGFLPAGDGKWTRMTVRDLCRLRLIRAMTDAGLPVGASLAHLAEEFLDSMHSMLIAAKTPGRYDTMLAVITRDADSNEYSYSAVFDLNDLSYLQSSAPDRKTTFLFETAIIINLGSLAAGMLPLIEDIRGSRKS